MIYTDALHSYKNINKAHKRKISTLAVIISVVCEGCEAIANFVIPKFNVPFIFALLSKNIHLSRKSV